MSEGQTLDEKGLFPEGLINWAGHRDGGVRRPFKTDSGRPTGYQIVTPLTSRLKSWVESLVAGEKVPRVVLLVGGPGNGKTDSVEGCIEYFDQALGAQGALISAFADRYNVSEQQLSPRKAVVNLSTIASKITINSSISLVQDATEGDSGQNKSPEELLLSELDSLLDPENDDIYLCCVNRGILARTAEVAHEHHSDSDVHSLINTITSAATSSPNSPSCWPLEGYPNFALWPMDVESLVDRNLSPDLPPVAEQIFRDALDPSKWKVACELKSRCPFCQNRKLLSQGNAINKLVDLLHFYELSSGKRWTFRDIFSLVSYLLVGDYSELEIKGKRHSPCEWAAEQNRLSVEGQKGSVERDRAPYLLMSRLYHHRLFPRWPKLDKGEHRKAKQALLGKNEDEGLDAAFGLFRFLARSQQISEISRGDVPVRIRNSVGPILDPALSSGKQVLFEREGQPFTVGQVEEAFSISVKDGLELISSQVETLERDVISKLALADESLIEDRFPRTKTKQARLLQSTLRQLASRITKRSIGTKNGVCLDIESFREYQNATQQTQALNKSRKALSKLLHDSNNKFRAGLATTFGQPVAHKSRDVALVLESRISVSTSKTNTKEGRPKEYIPYLIVEGHYVPLTFDLFKALKEVENGLHDASLPSEIYSLLDRVKSLVSGMVVRDSIKLSEDAVIQIGSGSSGDLVEYIDGEFNYIKEGN